MNKLDPEEVSEDCHQGVVGKLIPGRATGIPLHEIQSVATLCSVR